MAHVDLSTLPRTRKEAQALGGKHYFTGKPCEQGHVAARKTKGECTACLAEGRYRATREQSRMNTARHRDKVRASLKANGVLKACKWCRQEWMKPYGSTAAYCSPECQTAGYRAVRNANAAKPENKERKRAYQSKKFAELWQDPAYRAAEIQRSVSYRKGRRQTDAGFRIRDNLSSRINSALKAQNIQKSFSTMEICGCTTAELVTHLESQFRPGMSWENRSQWHIDHIRPCASFDLTDPEQQRECFHYSNLQPLWAEENIKKGASQS